ncbi:hypothetical protein [Nocardia brevicatena]|uniref:hypothetical protein n=1 Tax=Nocardia brevicatena TaxID=37327 RepID=UPI0002F4709C|nr:hypothetical protein [Nocardia brevicatena]
MENSRTKVAGPLAAAGAVSLGLVLIGACGIGQEDTYVAPPPIRSGLQAAPTPQPSDTTATTAQVIIPPSPTWQVAPEITAPRRTLPTQYLTSTTTATAQEGENPGGSESPDEATPTSAPTESTPEGQEDTTEPGGPGTAEPGTETLVPPIEPASSGLPVPEITAAPAPSAAPAPTPAVEPAVVAEPAITSEPSVSAESSVAAETSVPAAYEPAGTEQSPETAQPLPEIGAPTTTVAPEPVEPEPGTAPSTDGTASAQG